MMIMNKAKEILFSLSSLSIFRGILNRSVPKAYYKLLNSMDKKPEEFLNAYGEFFSLISERGCSNRLAYAFTEAALFDENCFTRAAAAGKYNTLPDNLLKAVKRDCQAILNAASLTSQELIQCYCASNDLATVADKVAKYYKENGCGIFARYKAFIWRDGDIQPVLHPDKIDMDSFTGYERQRDIVVGNTKSFIEGKACNNCLLYGDMGTGKSSTVKAIANEFRKDGLRIVEIPKERLIDFPILVDKIATLPMKFIIFIDDLSFQKQDQSYTTLKAVLEGGIAARPDNALIYATSNRRHLVKESFADRTDDDINTRDNMQETLSLSDRFGLSVCYSAPSKKEFLDIVFALAKENGVNLTEEELEAGAERFALSRGGRSPRCAKHYIESLFAK